MPNFKLKDTSLDVCKNIVENNPEIVSLELISHEVGMNWRQIHKSRKQKISNLDSAFLFSDPSKRKYSRRGFSNLTLEDLPAPKKHYVWSITSKVLCEDGTYRHIPMMNFHSEGVSIDEIIYSIKYICGDKSGALLNSGRFYHYYGNFLLNHEKWIQFIASFLIPCILVSPRYIGHRLHDGYSTLRLTNESTYKPSIPQVVHIF